MTGADQDGRESLPLTLEVLVKDVCRQFESAWQAALENGPPPRIEDYLWSPLESVREVLEVELVRIDIAYRRRTGAAVTPADYRRFANLDLTSLVESSEPLPHEPPSSGTPQSPQLATVESDFGQLPPTSPILRLPLPSRFGDYEVLEEIARGGMGVVYKARQVSLNRIVALKMILECGRLTPQAVQRFHREAQAAAALDHPNIVAVHASGEHEGRPFFSMAYVEGDNLHQVVRREGTPRPRRAAELVWTVAEAVEFAHQHGIIHRDLKPENVLIDRQNRPRVTDFGLAYQATAQPLGERLSHAGQVMGTPSYMAPEQAMGNHEDVGPSTDVYSLGGILYFLLTGHAPFKGRSLTEVLFQVVSVPPRRPSEVNPAVPAALEAICLRCLEKDPSRRYPSAVALAAALREAAPHLDPQPGPPPAGNSPAFPPDDPTTPVSALTSPTAPKPRTRRSRAPLWVALVALVLAGLAGAVWLKPDLFRSPLNEGPDGGTKPAPGRQPVLQLPPPEKLRQDFGLSVTMVRMEPGGGFTELKPGADGLVLLKQGEPIKFRVKVAEAAYVGIWSVNADGTICQLYPNAREQNHRFETGKEQVVPQTRAVAEPTSGPGIDWVWVQASTEPWRPDEGKRVGPFLLFQSDEERTRWHRSRGRVRGIVLDNAWTLSEAVLKHRVER